MPVFKKNSKHVNIWMFVVLIWSIISLIFITIPITGSDTSIIIDIDQDFQIADFTLTNNMTISLTGNFTIYSDSGGTIWFGILALEGWKTSFSPEYETLFFGTTVVPFEGEVAPSIDAKQGEYNVYVWASSTSPLVGHPEEGVPSIVKVIQNRVNLTSNITEQHTLPDSTITYTFAVANEGTVTDTFYIHLRDSKLLKNQGWIINSSYDNITLAPEEIQNFVIDMYIPPNATVGNHSIDVIVSSSKHLGSTSHVTIVTKVIPQEGSTSFWDLNLILIIVLIIIGICFVSFFIKRKV